MCEDVENSSKKTKRSYNPRVTCCSCLKRRRQNECSLVRKTHFHDGKVFAPALKMCRVCMKREPETLQCRMCKLRVCRFKGVGNVCVACQPVPNMILQLKRRGLFDTVQQIARHNNVELDRNGNPPDWFFLHHRLTSMGDVRVYDLIQQAMN